MKKPKFNIILFLIGIFTYENTFSQVSDELLNSNQIKARVITNTHSVLVGEEYQAEVVLIGYNASNEYEVFVNGNKLNKENGGYFYKTTPNSVGAFKWSGIIKVTTDNEVREFPFESDFYAFQGQVTVAATAMNVLYIGIPNPISISAPGFLPIDLIPEMVGGKLTRDVNGNWVAFVEMGTEAKITVSVQTRDGVVKQVGSTIYRVKPIPRPEAQWGDRRNGIPATKTELVDQEFITANLSAGFVFDGISFTITRYQFIFVPLMGDASLITATSNAIRPNMLALLHNAKKGDKLIVDKIYARRSDGGKEVALLPIFIEIY